MADCIFCGIASGDQDADMVVETDEVIAFRDLDPRAPVHVLVTPREHISSAHQLGEEHRDLVFTCFQVAQQVAEQEGVSDGYRIATNIGGEGGQAIEHLHFHVLGGKQLGPPDGT